MYLDMYGGDHADIVYSTRSDECSALSTTYLGRTNMMREIKVRSEEKFPISGHGYTLGKLLDDIDCQILLDMGASKSYMSKSFYLKCKTLQALPKFASNTQKIQVENDTMDVLFLIPVIVDIHGHRFEVFTFISEIHENVDLVLGMKNVFELEGVIDWCKSCFNFLNRSIPSFSKEPIVLKQKEQKCIIIEAPFVEEISAMAIVKMLDKWEQVTVTLKLKFIRNRVTLNVTSNTQDTVMFEPKEVIDILDLRLLQYYKIGQGVLQQNLSTFYHFESAEVWFEQFNKFVNTSKKEKEESKEEYPWLEKNDERKYITEKYWTGILTWTTHAWQTQKRKRWETCCLNTRTHLAWGMR